MSSAGSHLCCSWNRLQKTHPEKTDNDQTLLEVRRGRWLRICHLNPSTKEGHLTKPNSENFAQSHGNGDIVLEKKVVYFKPPSGKGLDVLPNSVNGFQPTRNNLSSPLHLQTRNGLPGSVPQPQVSLEADRGHSAASVAISVKSRTNGIPSPLLQEHQIPGSPLHLSEQSKQVDLNPQISCSQIKQPQAKVLSGAQSQNPSHPVLFFIHGVGGSADVWRAQLNYFSGLGFEIIAPDLIGHGYSLAPQNKRAYHFEEISQDIEVIFDNFCKKRNVVIGHSYGCSFAVQLARKRSRRVSKIILISGGGPTPLAPQPGVFSLPSCMLTCLRPCLKTGFNKSAFHKTSKVHVPKGQVFDIPTYVLSHTMNGQHWPDGDEVFHNWLNVATLLVYGKHDKLITLDEEKTMEETIYGSHLEVVDDASHMVMMEQPDVVNKLISDFITGLPPQDSRQDRIGEGRSSSLQSLYSL